MRNISKAVGQGSTWFKSAIAMGAITVFASGCAGCGSSGASLPALPSADSAPTVPTKAVVTGVSPSAGWTGGGTYITITGTSIQAGPAITVGGVDCSPVVVNSASSVSCTTGAVAATANAPIIVTNASAPASDDGFNSFTFQDAPTITSISPNAGAMPAGTSVTFTGLAIAPGVVFTIGSGPQTCTPGSVSADQTSATCLLVGNPVLGSNDVVADNGGAGGQSTDAGGISVNAAPVVSSLSPNNGAPAGGVVVTITGSHFLTAPTSITVGGTPCTAFSYVNSTTMHCTTPAKAAGSYAVVVTNSDGQASNSNIQFTYNPLPTVSSIAEHTSSAAHGSTVGGYRVDLVGTGFIAGLSVSLGGVSCTSAARDSATTAHCTTASHVAGSVTAVVTNVDGQSSSAGGSYRYDSMFYLAQSGNSNYIAADMAADGSLSNITGAIHGGVDAVLIATNPTQAKVYVATDSARKIDSYTVNGDGSLTYSSEIQLGATKTFSGSNALVVAPNGNFALISSDHSGTGIVPIPIDGTTHDLSAAGTSVTPSDGTSLLPNGVIIDSTSSFAWGAFESGSALCSFSTDSTTGALTQLAAGVCLSGANTPGNLSSLALSANNNYIYGVGNGNGHVFSYSLSGGVPTKLAETALSGGTGALQVVTTPNNFLYVVNNTHTSIGYSEINPANGDLTSDGTTPAAQTNYAVAGAVAISGIAVDPSRHFLYVADSTNNDVRILTIGAHGALSEVVSSFNGGGAILGSIGLSFTAK